jgi:acyl-CoA thioesterase-1
VLITLLAAFVPPEVARSQEEKQLPRVLIIGDSISIGYTEPVRKQLKGVALVFRPNENCQHTAHGLARINAWLGKEKWDVIHFNWGIWDTHMLSAKGGLVQNEAKFEGEMRIRHTPERYRENLVKLVDTMEKTGAKLIWASTTPIMSRTGKRFDDIKKYNAVAEKVMRERMIPVNDLYGYVLPNAKEWQSGDKVHFNAVGNENLAKRVAESIRMAVGAKEPSQGKAK